MFSEIEKEYRKDVRERRYLDQYAWRAVPITIIAIILSLIFRQINWVVYLVAVVFLVTMAVILVIRDVRMVNRIWPKAQAEKSIVAKLKRYFKTDDTMRVGNLVQNLARHGLQTREDLKVALDYFESRLPVNTKARILDWVLTAIVTVASVALVAYDEATNRIDLAKFVNVFASALIVAGLCITPILVFKFMRFITSNSRNRIDTILVEDLAYIYINFERYAEKLANSDNSAN